MHRPHLYRLQYQNKLWGNLRKFGKKNVFPQKYDEIRRLDGRDETKRFVFARQFSFFSRTFAKMESQRGINRT